MTNWWQSIRDRTPQIKGKTDDWGRDVILIAVVLFVGISAFGLGRLSATEDSRPAVRMVAQPTLDETPMLLGGKLVASRKGSKYHYPWCSGARTMSETNKVWFGSEEAAKKAGYTPAGNCKGLK